MLAMLSNKAQLLSPEGSTMSMTNDVQLALADGTVCSVLFTPDQGASITRQGQLCGTISDAELSEFASRRNGAMELAAQVEEMLGQQALMMSSQDALMNAAYCWFEQYF